MRGVLTAEVPSLHRSLVALTLRDCLHVDELSDAEVTWTESIAYRQEVLRSYRELYQLPLGRQIILQEVACLRFGQVLQSLFSAPYLDGIPAIFFFRLDLSDLAPVYLYHRAGHELSPFVPEMSHPYLVPEEPHSSRLSRDWCRLLYGEVLIDLILKGVKGGPLVGDTMHILEGDCGIVEYCLLLEVHSS